MSETTLEPTEDYTVFGDTWVYCSQHRRPHPTGWCTVSPRDKMGLGTNVASEAYDKCRAMGLYLHDEPRPDAAIRAERDALRARLDALTAALAPALAIEADVDADADDLPTPAPWGEFCESGEWWIEHAGADGGPANFDTPTIVCCDSGADMWPRQSDIELTIALRNALPAVRMALETTTND